MFVDQGERQQGFALLEVVVSIPMMVLLLVSLGTAVFWGLHHYLYFLADAELQQEVQVSFQRVVDDMLEAREIQPLPIGRQGYTLIKTLPAGTKNAEEKTVRMIYEIHTIQGTHKLVCGDVEAPMTGNHSLAGVTITTFSCEPESGEPGLYTVRLTGKSEVTKHVYSLETAVYLPADKSAAD